MSSLRLRLGEKLVERLVYNPETGELKYKYIVSKKKPTLEAGCINKDGYLVITYKGMQFNGHILAWRLYYGVWPTKMLDHKDRNRSNNRIKNLREATNQENQLNSKVQDRPWLGISYNIAGNNWKVTGPHPERKHLGYFTTYEKAKAVRDAARKINSTN